MRRFLVVGACLAACAADPAPQRGAIDPPPAKAQELAAPDPLFHDAAAFARLPPSSPTGWRARFDEPGQTYLDYLGTVPRRPTPDAERLYLLPLGEMGTAFVVDAEVTYIVRTPPTDQMAALLTVFFGLPTEVLPSVELGALAEPDRIRRGHEQFRAQLLLGATAPLLPGDAYSMTALMVQDVFFDDAQVWGYGFGQHRDGQAVVSFARIDPVVSGLNAEPDVLERLPLRAFTLLVHEVGHTFGFEHCAEHRCVMNGIADLAELDATPLHLCPECLRKLLYLRPTDPAARYRALSALYGQLGLEAPRQWTQARERSLEREAARPTAP